MDQLARRLRRYAFSLVACCACTSSTPAPASRDSRQEGSRTATADKKGMAPAHEVTVAEEAIARVGIHIEKVVEQAAEAGIEIPAEVHVEPDRQAHIASVVPGQIAHVSASVGDHVKAGQALAVIRSVALGEARAQASRAVANMEVAKANFRRQEELHREGIGAERQYLEAQAELRRAEAEQSAADRALEVYGRGGRGSEVTIKSPIDGRVVERHATVGEVIAPSDTLFTVMDTSSVWIVGRVYPRDAKDMREGAPASFHSQNDSEHVFAGKLSYVAPTLDVHTRTLPVRMVLDNPDGMLRPGSFGTLSVSPTTETAQALPAVETTALQRLGDDTVVFVPMDKPGSFRAIKVKVLSRTVRMAVVQGDLHVGQEYVADGGFVLKSELQRDGLPTSE